jgi:hypothetical protein
MYCCGPRNEERRGHPCECPKLTIQPKPCQPKMNTGVPDPPLLFRSSEPSQSTLELSYPDRQESQGTVPANALQYEIDQLKGVSTRLDSLANQHLIVEQEIMSISGNILSSAVLLEVLLATRIKPA